MFDYYNTRLMSTHVIKIINEFERFHVKNKIFFNIPKDYVFFFLNFFFEFLKIIIFVSIT
jgi:hypothetical protein